MKKSTGECLHHPHYGQVINITPPDSTGKRQRLSQSGHTVIDIKLPNGERRTLLLSSFAPEPPPSVPPVETSALTAA